MRRCFRFQYPGEMRNLSLTCTGGLVVMLAHAVDAILAGHLQEAEHPNVAPGA